MAAPPTRTVDLDVQSVLTAIAAVVGLVALVGVVRDAPRTITWLVVGSLLALALNQVVTKVERRLGGRRGVAVGVVLGGLVLAVALIVGLLVPPAVRQAQDLGDQLPEVLEQLGDLPVVGDDLEENDVPARVEEWLDELPDRLTGEDSPVDDWARSALGGALAAVATLLVAVALLLDADWLRARARGLVPERHRERASRAAATAYRVVGRYFAGSVLVAALAGLAVLVVGLALGVPLTPVAALWVAVSNLIPQIGGALGGLLFVALGLTDGALTGLACAAFFVLYLQFENHVLQPLVVGRSVDLSPPATMTAALVGVAAGGVVGALVAVPLLGATKALYLEFRGESRSEGTTTAR